MTLVARRGRLTLASGRQVDGYTLNGASPGPTSEATHGGQTYEIAFVADNPGIWMDHCHNLPRASEGLVAHLAHADVTTPFLVGGPGANRPE